MALKTLDGKIPTLDASQLSYEFEKARIKGVEGTNNLLREYSKQENVAMPENFEYVSSFRDPHTGTSGAAFKDTTSGKTIIAYTGTNPDTDLANDAILTDGIGIGVGTGHHYSSAYQFYEDVLKKNDLNPEDVILTGHSLGGNVAQRVALKYNAPKTIVYNSAPLYVPTGAVVGNGLIGNPLLALASAKNIAEIESDKARFTGSVTRITTEQDPLNKWSDRFGGVYLGDEYVIPHSGGHLMGDLRAVSGDIQKIEQSTIAIENVERSTQVKLKGVQSKKERFKVNDIGTGSPNGLSKAELIALDSEQALVVASGLSTASTAAITFIEAKVTSAVEKAKALYDTLDDVPFGFILSPDEVKQTYNESGVNYISTVEAVDSHCQSVKSNADTIATSFVDLETKIKAGVEQIVQKDTELQGLIAHG
ncbi:hypothetical protein ACVRXQ_09545 [Streptococcus panodentis]|uniref:Lipase n=1 Tax=Streptococcus panodentis TaxID=1581472 RepID=A0ABS5AW20_9STRE|nr:hypothetical protein [Streptococcus panodentis]MBP2620769.1 hypothetical protein [Streptococcus panodentis]